ncbi:hypothetical protein [Streptomyces sp. NPDC004726]
MQTVFAAFTVLGGLVAVLAGVHGLRQTSRIKDAGHLAVALVKPPPPGADRVLLEYETRDGRVMEIVSPAPRLAVGSSVRVSYDPGDPRDVVVDGHERTGVDKAFVTVGLLLTAVGLGLVVWGAAPGS